MLLVLIAGAALGLVSLMVFGSPFAERPVTKAEIEHAVAERPRGKVQFVLCNEVFVPSQTPRPKSQHSWTCDTYVGSSRTDTQNGPSYAVTVDDQHIESIRRVATH
jgi:Na+/glutamate symporter